MDEGPQSASKPSRAPRRGARPSCLSGRQRTKQEQGLDSGCQANRFRPQPKGSRSEMHALRKKSAKKTPHCFHTFLVFQTSCQRGSCCVVVPATAASLGFSVGNVAHQSYCASLPSKWCWALLENRDAFFWSTKVFVFGLFLTFWKVKCGKGGVQRDPKSSRKIRKSSTKKHKQTEQQKQQKAQTTGKAQTTSRTNSSTNSTKQQQHRSTNNRITKTFLMVKSGRRLVFSIAT